DVCSSDLCCEPWSIDRMYANPTAATAYPSGVAGRLVLSVQSAAAASFGSAKAARLAAKSHIKSPFTVIDLLSIDSEHNSRALIDAPGCVAVRAWGKSCACSET